MSEWKTFSTDFLTANLSLLFFFEEAPALSTSEVKTTNQHRQLQKPYFFYPFVSFSSSCRRVGVGMIILSTVCRFNFSIIIDFTQCWWWRRGECRRRRCQRAENGEKKIASISEVNEWNVFLGGGRSKQRASEKEWKKMLIQNRDHNFWFRYSRVPLSNPPTRAQQQNNFILLMSGNWMLWWECTSVSFTLLPPTLSIHPAYKNCIHIAHRDDIPSYS